METNHQSAVLVIRAPATLPFEAEIFCHIHPSELGNPDAMITQFQLIVGQIKARLTSLLALETRAAALAFKEGRKRFAQIQKGLI